MKVYLGEIITTIAMNDCTFSNALAQMFIFNKPRNRALSGRTIDSFGKDARQYFVRRLLAV